MATSTRFGQTPWSTDELAALHGVAGPRARRKQEDLDELIHDELAARYISRGTRPDQAVASIRARVARLHRLFESGDARVVEHFTRLVRKANDLAGAARLDRAAKRFPGEPARRKPASTIRPTGRRRVTA